MGLLVVPKSRTGQGDDDTHNRRHVWAVKTLGIDRQSSPRSVSSAAVIVMQDSRPIDRTLHSLSETKFAVQLFLDRHTKRVQGIILTGAPIEKKTLRSSKPRWNADQN